MELEHRVRTLEIVLDRLIAHLAEDGSLSHETYDLVHEIWQDLQTPPQYPDVVDANGGIPLPPIATNS